MNVYEDNPDKESESKVEYITPHTIIIKMKIRGMLCSSLGGNTKDPDYGGIEGIEEIDLD